MLKYILLIIAILTARCAQKDCAETYSNYANQFHLNFNSKDYESNYNWIKKYSGMDTSLGQYLHDFEYIKQKMGNFKKSKIKNINFDQVTSSGEKLIQVSYDSEFEKGDAKEFFYFGEKNQFYRYELYSKNLLQ